LHGLQVGQPEEGPRLFRSAIDAGCVVTKGWTNQATTMSPPSSSAPALRTYLAIMLMGTLTTGWDPHFATRKSRQARRVIAALHGVPLLRSHAAPGIAAASFASRADTQTSSHGVLTRERRQSTRRSQVIGSATTRRLSHACDEYGSMPLDGP